MIVIDKDNKNLVIPNGLGNINRDYQEGYEAGYQESFEEGKAEGLAEGRAEGLAEGKAIGIAEGKQEQKDLLEAITITENGTYNKEDGYNQVVVNVEDTNGSYDEGYADGVADQKAKLTNITISENGTYTREDGYNSVVVDVQDLNGSYDEGYADGEAAGVENAGAIIAETARVLDITENGFYLSKYSDPIYPDVITGVYPGGENFYNYALIQNSIYSTGIIPKQNTRLEFWFKSYGTEYEEWEIIIGSQSEDDANDTFQVRRYSTSTYYYAEIGTSEVSFTMSENEWHHIIMSVADGFVLDGTKIGDFSENMTDSNTPLQIGGSINFNGERTEEGYYGMIKITTDGVENIIIPTEDGFKNITTDEMLQVVQGGDYVFTEELPIISEDNLIKTVNVNVVPKINVVENGIKLGYSTFTEVPEWADFEGITNMSHMFEDCKSLTTIPEIDTSNVTYMNRMFYNCNNLQTIPTLDTSNVTNMEEMFSYCGGLTTIPEIDTSKVTNMGKMFYNCGSLTTIPTLDTSNVTNMGEIFRGCSNLTTIPEIDTSKVTAMNNMFGHCLNLISIPALDCSSIDTGYNSTGWFGYDTLPNLTNIGGFINLKISSNNNYGLVKCPNLTYESCINILNGLYDFTGNGETPTSSQGQLKVHQNFLDLVGDEISIGVNKGWTITA